MKWILPWIFALILILCLPIAVSADDTTAVVTITMAQFTGGVTDFTITYVNDTQMDLTWNLGGDAVNIMIRAKYGAYPANIPDEFTAPSDGYLVYYGSGTLVSDTSMNFDQNPGALYYEAWAQRGDGTWHTDIQSGWKESVEMAFLGFIALAGIITALAFKNPKEPNMALIVGAAGSWAVLMAYVIFYPPGNMAAGSTVQQLIVVVLGGVAMAVLVGGVRMNANLRIREESEEQPQEPQEERQGQRTYTRRQPVGYSTSSRVTPYRARIHAALHPHRPKD